jgi:hypothetical protein
MIEINRQNDIRSKEWIPFGTNFNNFYKKNSWNQHNNSISEK